MRRVARRRVGGIFFGNLQWEADTVCPRCGTESGAAWTVMTSGHSPTRNPLKRLLLRLSLRRRGMRKVAERVAEMRRRAPHFSAGGRLDLAQLLTAVPFPVYGLKGQPLGLRLVSPGWGSKNANIDHVNLGYVRGHRLRPGKAMNITQGSERPMDELRTIRSLLYNFGPEEQRKMYSYRGDFHRDWNTERLTQTPRQQATIEVNGQAVEVELVSWEEPQRVALARLTLGENHLQAASLNLSHEQLLDTLGTLVALQEDGDTLAQHQQDYDEARREMLEHHASSTSSEEEHDQHQ